MNENDQDMDISRAQPMSSTQVVLPGYLSDEILPEVADILYFPHMLYWMPTGFTDVEVNAVAEFPAYCGERRIDMPDSVWNLLSWYRESDERALSAAELLHPLREAQLVQYLLPVYGRGQREVEVARQALLADSDLQRSLSTAPFDACLFARELIGHALFGVFVEAGYEGSVRVFRDALTTEESFTDILGAATINRISAMLRTDMIPLIYDQGWLSLFNAIKANRELTGENGGEPSTSQNDEREWPLEYSTFRIFGEILRPVFGVCDTVSKNSWVAQMREGRADDIARLRSECKDVAVSMLGASGEIPSVRTEILRRELQNRIADPLQALASTSKRQVREVAKSVVFDSTVIGTIFGMLTNFDPRTIGLSVVSAAVASIGRQMLESPSAPGHLCLLRDGLIATEGQYAELRRHLLALSVSEVVT
jgi:hypothetical protein